MTAHSQGMTLAELTEAADVSTRTVRYYIAEGLLPPPEGAGPASVYTAGHLARLRLIQHLKGAYWPLKEIRRRLAGLSDAEVEAMLVHGDVTAIAHAPPGDSAMAPARDYLAMMEQRAAYRTSPMQFPAAPPQDVAPSVAPRVEHRQHDVVQGEANLPVELPEGSLWRRISLGEDAELVISEQAYARHRERIDWLVRWARKVFS